MCKLLMVIVFTLIHSSMTFAFFDENFDVDRHFLNKENFYDYKAYQYPLAWNKIWYRSKNSMRGSTGSVSIEQFYFNHEIKLEGDLTDNVSVLYSQNQYEFFREQPIYQELELRYGDEFYLSIIGFPKHEKKRDNMGIAVSYGKRHEEKFIRLSYLNQHAQYNEKNQNSDKNSIQNRYSRTPRTYRLEVDYKLFDKLRVKVDSSLEPEAKLDDFSNSLYKHYKGYSHYSSIRWIEKAFKVGLDYSVDIEERWHTPGQNATDNNFMSQTLELSHIDLWVNFFPSTGNEVTIGLMHSYFKNDIGSSIVSSKYKNTLKSDQLYGFWNHDLSSFSKSQLSLQIGNFDLKKYVAEAINEDEEGLKGKLGVGLLLTNQEKFQIVVLTTWALDTLKNNQWDGGNVQFQATF